MWAGGALEVGFKQLRNGRLFVSAEVVLVGNSFGSLISLVSATQRRPKGLLGASGRNFTVRPPNV